MRNAFRDELILAAEKADNIALVVGDLGFGVLRGITFSFVQLQTFLHLDALSRFVTMSLINACR